jgi:hypothetical protein
MSLEALIFGGSAEAADDDSEDSAPDPAAHLRGQLAARSRARGLMPATSTLAAFRVWRDRQRLPQTYADPVARLERAVADANPGRRLGRSEPAAYFARAGERLLGDVIDADDRLSDDEEDEAAKEAAEEDATMREGGDGADADGGGEHDDGATAAGASGDGGGARSVAPRRRTFGAPLQLGVHRQVRRSTPLSLSSSHVAFEGFDVIRAWFDPRRRRRRITHSRSRAAAAHFPWTSLTYLIPSSPPSPYAAGAALAATARDAAPRARRRGRRAGASWW